MCKKTLQDAITLTDWINLSHDQEILHKFGIDSYSKAYPILSSYFKTMDKLDWDAAVLGLHIVYGWMPTIPKLGQIMDWDDWAKQQLVACLSKAKQGKLLKGKELEILKSFSNNSMVGGSKLLHFLNPDVFPIWDSRVAKIFLQKTRIYWYQVNSINTWKIYRETLEKWINDPEVMARCKVLCGQGVFFNKVTNLRLVELVMFHAGG